MSNSPELCWVSVKIPESCLGQFPSQGHSHKSLELCWVSVKVPVLPGAVLTSGHSHSLALVLPVNAQGGQVKTVLRISMSKNWDVLAWVESKGLENKLSL